MLHPTTTKDASTKGASMTETPSVGNGSTTHNIQSFPNGHVAPKVHFNLWSAIGIQYSLTAAPIAIGFYLSLVIGLGGSAGYFWDFIMVAVFQMIVCLAVCELASAMPHSSGPAHWVQVLAGPRFSVELGYIMGWLTTGGWFFIMCATILYPAQLIMAVVEVVHPDYYPKSWHTYLLYVAIALVFLVLNLPRIFKAMSWLLMGVVFLINGTALYIFISLLVKASPKQSAHFVFLEFANSSGWKDGVVFFIAILPAMTCLAGFDNITHITDELENPSTQVPQVLIGSYVMSVVTTIPMIMVYEFCNVDPESLLEAVGDQPLMQLMLNAFKSDAMAIVGMVLIIVSISISGCSALISWSRLYWSFSRYGILPMSKTMSKLSSRDALPVNAMLWCTFLACCLGAISIGSYTAMNAFLGAATLCVITSLVTAFTLTLFHGRKNFNPNRAFKLGGWWGDAIFGISALWSAFAAIMLAFPLYLPVTLVYMNWACVVFGGVIVLSGLYYVLRFRHRRDMYQDPYLGEVHQENHGRHA
ncbi:hypothetical protein VTL71DRAFT_14039 [Oculimacula yallundae]|uniref:Amino acid transporter n=1 Tax=Oculimacula yallundae TaxID=86028 RepID=A0ABR4CM23_9HELO